MVSHQPSDSVVNQSSDASHYDHYEKAQVYEKAQTYERIHHCDIQLPQSKSNQESLITKPSSIAQNDQGGEASGSGYERARTYERIHHCDIPLYLLPQTKQTDGLDLESVNVDQSTTSQNDEHKSAEGTTYEQIHHSDISPHLLSQSKPSQDKGLVDNEHSIPLCREHEEVEKKGGTNHEQIQ